MEIKAVNATQLNADLTDIADAIRAKGGTSELLAFPAEFISEINAISTGIEPQRKVWQQTPAAVQNYLDNVTYDPADYTVSHIAEYAPAETQYANPDTKPVGVNVTTDAGTLEQGGYKRTVSAGTNTLYNAVPNKETAYSLINGETKQTGVLAPTGALRWINSATPNMRDLGGWNCDGGTVKYGKLFRGGEIVAADKDMAVNQLGIRHELNLLGNDPNYEQNTTSPWGIEFTRFERYIWYSLADTKTWRGIISCVFDSILHEEPLYFHCGAGADRTGTVAVILEGLLGVSQSDIDKDYELTSFFYGTATDSPTLRTDPDYRSLINGVNNIALPAGVPNSFRNKTVYFVASLGFTADEINAFRAAMIEGTPDTITLDLQNYSVTKNGTDVVFDNAAASVPQYQSYQTKVSAARDKLFTVNVTMGGQDITQQCFSGCEKYRRFAVTYNLTDVNSSTSKKCVIANEIFAAKLTAAAGYRLDTVNITMGGQDMSQYYENGIINIPEVTGDIVITATAVTQAPAYTNLFVPSGAVLNKRLNSSHAQVDQNGYIISNPIDISQFASGSTFTVYCKGLRLCGVGDRITIKTTAEPITSSATMVSPDTFWIDETTLYGKIDIQIPQSPKIYTTLFLSLGVGTACNRVLTEADLNDIIVTLNEPIV